MIDVAQTNPCPQKATTPSADTLERIANQITQTIYSSPFAQATRRQQELTLTCAQKICDAMQEAQTCPP